MVNFQDKVDNEKKFALYRYDAETKIPEHLAKVILGKRSAENALNYEHIRNYSFSQHPIEQKDEFICQIDKEKNQMQFFPISTKLALLKKKRNLDFVGE